MRDYMKETDRLGKIWIWTACVVVLMVPAAACVYYNAWPEMTAVLKGLLGVAPIYWTVGLIEVITYTPMLGVGGTYLSFVTGNLTSLKAPSALSAMENCGVKPGSEEGEVISTIAIAVSTIVSKNWKLSLAPLLFMIALFTAVPSLAGSVGVLVPVGILIALGAARVMYKKGWL